MPLLQRTALTAPRAFRTFAGDHGPFAGFEPVRPISTGKWFELWQARAGRERGQRASNPSSADYAIKALRPSVNNRDLALALLQREAAVAAEVFHPNLVTVLAQDLRAETPYLITPFLPGNSLAQVVQAGRKCPVPQVLWHARQAAEAIGALHAQGWLHGDVKPSNFMVSEQGHLTLIDLGLARKLETSECATETWLAGDTSFLAPEAYLPRFELTAAADVYSLGLTLLNLLGGTTAPRTEPLLDNWQAANNLRVKRPEVSREIATLIAKMTATEPLRRPTIAELTSTLSRLEIESLMQW